MRVQALQDSFAKFCSELMQIKAEIICKHFDPETIAQQANVLGMVPEDQKFVGDAVALIKNPQQMYLRVVIKPESVAMIDFAKLQQERTDFIQALGFFMQSAAPLVQEAPESTPYLLQMLQWGLAGFKGSDQIEGVLDGAIEKMKANPPGAKPDPKADAEKAKMQGQLQIEQLKGQVAQAQSAAKMQELQLQAQQSQVKFQQDMAEQQKKHENEMRKLVAEFQSQMQILSAQTESKVIEQSAQTEGKLVETSATTEAKLIEQRNKAEEGG